MDTTSSIKVIPDFFILLLDSFRVRYEKEKDFDRLLEFADLKLDIISNREYDKKPDENGVYRSIKK